MKILYHDQTVRTIIYKTKEEVERLYAEDTSPKAILTYSNDGSLVLFKSEM